MSDTRHPDDAPQSSDATQVHDDGARPARRAKRGPGAHIAARVRRRLALARLALVWEALWRTAWPAVCVIGVFLIAAGLDILPALPAWLHAIVLAGFAAWLAWAIFAAVRGFRAPDGEAAARRLEHDSGVDHRPLVTLDDRLAAGAGNPEAEALWQVHLRRALDAARRLRVRLPHPGLAGYDPYALRFAVLVGLVVAVAAAHEDPEARLLRAVSPDLSGSGGIPPASLEVWVTPPDYTGLAPQLLTNKVAGKPTAPTADTDASKPAAPIRVPAGSQILAQINDGSGDPVLTLGDDKTPLHKVGERAWRIELTADSGGAAARKVSLAVRQDGDTLGEWPLVVVADKVPTIEFASPPQPSRRNALKLEYHAQDDFGITGVVARIERPAGKATPRDKPIELSLPMTGRNMRDGGTTTFHDLTAHPWAGLPVEIQLEARDALGQVGRSDKLAITLPERTFTNPVAREIIDQRKLLTQAPDDRASVAEGLSAIASLPGRYKNDLTVFMALIAARSQLVHDRTDNAIAEVQRLLWNTALHIEDGSLSLAEQDLRELQQRLQEALARNASDQEIRKLTEELRKALDRLFEALADQVQKMMERGELPQIDPLDPNVQTLDRQDLEKMLDKIEQLAQTGARDAAQQLLSQMQQMLENLRNGQLTMQRRSRGSQQAQQMMRDMQNILRQQQELQDRAFRQQQKGERSGEGDAAAQDALRRQLGDLMRRLGEMSGGIPGEFGEAEQAMRRAGNALGEGQPGQAVGPQGEAMDLLRQGAQSAMQAMRGKGGPGNRAGFDNMGRPNNNRDPLGRPLPGTFGAENTSDVGVPDEGDLQRAREILKELRSRASDRMRPPEELDYLERLLKRF